MNTILLAIFRTYTTTRIILPTTSVIYAPYLLAPRTTLTTLRKNSPIPSEEYTYSKTKVLDSTRKTKVTKKEYRTNAILGIRLIV